MMYMLVCLLLHYLRTNAVPIAIGDDCSSYMRGTRGTCKMATDCPVLIESIAQRQRHNLTRCGFSGRIELVCCPSNENRWSGPNGSPSYGVPSRETLQKVQQVCTENNNLITSIKSPQILKGKDAVLGEFPHMAALGYIDFINNNESYFCGGTLISPYYVLTAAHCLLKRQKVEFVRLGAVDISTTTHFEGKNYDVEEQIINPNYEPRSRNNDIALLRLKQPAIASQEIKYACLYDKKEDPNVLVATGWGTTEDKGMIGSPILQKVNLELSKKDKCGELLFRSILDTQMCAESAIGADTCQGDSGGPLQIQLPENDVMSIVSVTSIGMGCGSRPGIYTKVYFYLNWIMDIIRK